MGLDFFRRALEVERDALPEGWQVERTIQTNGTLLDDEWAAFLAENNVLVGLSIDGPRELHDAYRHDGAGRSVFDKVEAAARLLQKHGVEFNVLCTVNAANAEHPLDVYRYFRDELGARYLQFIPIVEVATPPADGVAGTVTDRSVAGARVRRVPLGDLRRVGAPRRGRDVRAVLRRRARRVRARRLLAVRAPPDVRRRRRARAQRRRVLVRPLRRHAVPARQHHGDADRRARALGRSSARSARRSATRCRATAASASSSSRATASAPRTASCSRPTASPASTGCARDSSTSSRTPTGA